MPNSSQKPAVSLKIPNEDLMDMDVLCTFKIKIESRNLDHEYLKDRGPYKIKIKMPNPSQEPPMSSKAPSEDFKDIDVLCIFKINIESQNLEHGCFKDH